MDGVTATQAVPAPPEIVYSFLTEPALMAMWLGGSRHEIAMVASDPAPDGALEIVTRIEDEDAIYRGQWTERTPPSRVAYTWTSESAPDVVSTVEIDITAVDDGSEVTGNHANLPDDLRLDYEFAWPGLLATLADAVWNW